MDISKPTVAVLLSTYNGALFLREQLDSIINQVNVVVKLHVRDDGSTDDTVSILKEYSRRGDLASLTLGHNIGVVASYFALLAANDHTADYFAFADQDDLWLPDKMSRAAERLGGVDLRNGVGMYFTNVEFVDAKLKHLGFSDAPRYIGFPHALVGNIAVGCTVVITRQTRDLVSAEFPKLCLMHDWWIYIVVSALGTIVFDDFPFIKYRQHGMNVVGGGGSRLWYNINKVQSFIRKMNDADRVRVSHQASEFMRIYKNMMTSGQLDDVEGVIAARDGLINKVRFALFRTCRRNSRIDDLFFSAQILTGRF